MTGGLQPIHLRHKNIHQYDIVFLTFQVLQYLNSVSCHVSPIAQLIEHLHSYHLIDDIILCQQNAQRTVIVFLETVFLEIILDKGYGFACRNRLNNRSFCINYNMKSGSFSRFALHPYFSPHQFYQLLAYSEAQTGASVLTSDRGIYLAESLEQAIHFIRRDSYSRVLYRKMDLIFAIIFLSARHGYGYLTLVCELHGIAENIDQDLTKPGGVTDNRSWRVVTQNRCHFEPFVGGQGCYLAYGLFQATGKIEGLAFQLGHGGFDLG